MRKEVSNTGFGADSSRVFKRIINADGSYNINRIGATAKWKDAYKYLIEISWSRFFLWLLTFYISLNLIFTILYWFIGFNHITGVDRQADSVFMQIFFFSVQTFTTVGYGVMAPTGFWTQMLSSIEAFTGFLSFSLMTGLLYGRFSKPVSKIIFSKNAIVAPYKEGTSLQIKIANERDNVLMDVSAKMILVFDTTDDQGDMKKHYFQLPLEVSEVSLLPLSWTIVHPINEESPLFGKSQEEISALHAELLIIISGYDEVFSQVINDIKSYYHTDILWNWKFKKIFAPGTNGDIIIDLTQLNAAENLNHASKNNL
jgi:inward rectifier potassium channel